MALMPIPYAYLDNIGAHRLAEAIRQSPVCEGMHDLDYSLTEQDTGIKWLDGKTVYQMTFMFANPTSIGATTTYKTGKIITGLSSMLEFSATYVSTNATWKSDSRIAAPGALCGVDVNEEILLLFLVAFSSLLTNSMYITIRYTKQ